MKRAWLWIVAMLVVVPATAQTQVSSINLGPMTAGISDSTLCDKCAPGSYLVGFALVQTGVPCMTPGSGSVRFLLSWVDERGVRHSSVMIPTVRVDGDRAIVDDELSFKVSITHEIVSGKITITTNGSKIKYGTMYTACNTGTGAYSLRVSAWRLSPKK